MTVTTALVNSIHARAGLKSFQILPVQTYLRVDKSFCSLDLFWQDHENRRNSQKTIEIGKIIAGNSEQIILNIIIVLHSCNKLHTLGNQQGELNAVIHYTFKNVSIKIVSKRTEILTRSRSSREVYLV